MEHAVALLILAGFIWFIYQRSSDDSPIKKAGAVIIGLGIATWDKIVGLF